MAPVLRDSANPENPRPTGNCGRLGVAGGSLFDMQIDRREFLAGSSRTLASISLIGLVGCAAKQTSGAWQDAAAAGARVDKPRLFEISLAQWSLHRSLRKKTIRDVDFARVASEQGFTAIEYVNQFFKDKARDRDHIAALKNAAADHGVKSLLIMCDGEGRLGNPAAERRTKAIENHYKWVEAARDLGCHSIRVNAGSRGSYEEQMRLAADGLRRLTEFGAEHDIDVIVENHGGLSSNGAWLAAVMREVDHPRCGTLPDFGNFNLGGGKTYDRYLGVRELMPFAKAVSAKSHDFDADGNETATDYLKMMKIVMDAGYHGYVGVEYEGSKLAELEGIAATKRLLERVRGELV